MIFSRILSRYTLLTVLVTVGMLIIHSASSHDCSPPSRESTCECTATSIECSGTANNSLEFQDTLIAANFSHMEIVTLKIVDLKFETNFTFENTSILNLTLGYGLKDLPRDFFSGSSSLVSLNLNNNSIGTIDEQLFYSLSALKLLSLDMNEMQDLSSSMFGNLVNLNYLSMSRNNLQEINSDVFQNLSSLQTLILNHNNISSTKNLKMVSTSLTELKITHCSIEGSLEKDTFSNVPNLEHLDMSYNGLTEVKHQSLSTLKELKFLSLSYNSIKQLHEHAFSEMRNLTSLDLKDNEISVIKLTSFENLKNLKYLDLSGNKLTAILCEYTTDFESLERINLQNNNIKTFNQGAFFYSPFLQSLDVSGNNLECSCPLTDTALYLSVNSSMKREDLESVPCIIPSTLSSVSVIEYESSKCAPIEPCKKLDPTVTEEPDDEDYDYYADDGSTTASTDVTTTSTAESTSVFTTNASASVTYTTHLTTESSSKGITESIMDNTTTDMTSTLPWSTMNATASITYTTPKTTELSSENITESTTDTTTTNIVSTQPVSTMNATAGITYTTSITTEPSTASTIGSIMNTTVEIITSTTTTTTTSESTYSATTNSTMDGIHVTERLTTETSILSTKNAAITNSVVTKNSCSSLSLSVPDSSPDSEFKVFSNFSFDGSTFCLKWTVVGTLNNIKRCIIKYTFGKGLKSTALNCPSIANEIQTWSYDEKIFKICIDIYAPRKESFCNNTLYRTTTTPLNMPNVTLSQESLETVTLLETTTYPTNATSGSSVYTTKPSTQSDPKIVPLETTSHKPDADTTTPKLDSDTTTPNPDSDTTTPKPDSGTTTPKPDFAITTLKSSSSNSEFYIHTLNVYFNNSNLAFATWTVNTEELPHLCNMTLKATTQYFDYEEGVFPCKNNSHRLRNVKETDIFKICIISHHKIRGTQTECTLSVSPALASKSEKDGDDSFNGSMIPLICLLILLVLIVLFIVLKNVYKKKKETNRYAVRDEEIKYQHRVKERPISSNEQTMRFSYIARENVDNV